MATISLQEPVYHGRGGPVLFAAGFRPFFLFAGINAAVMLPLWLAVWSGALGLPVVGSPGLWHGHEMVFGFAAAALGGFLLTAVPSWTGCRYVSGKPLMVLFGLWLAGRVVFSLSGLLPALLVAVVDLAYLPLLAGMLARPLLDAKKWRNIAFLPILTLFWVADLAVHLGLAGIGNEMAGIYGGIALLLVMITIVGGRIVPSFTENWLRMEGRPVAIRRIRWIEMGGAVGSIAVAGAATVLAPGSMAAGVLMLVAAVIHSVRLSGWNGLRILGNPLLWVLHVGYLWLIVGLILMGLAGFGIGLPTASLHALTAGCVATMILGVMSRAALGHAGRPLAVSGVTVAAYVLVSVGALLRVIAPQVPGAMAALTITGGVVWTLAWLLFVVVYWPVLTRPRADGRPG